MYVRDPVGVDFLEGGACIDTFLRLEGTDEDAIWGEEVCDGGAFSEEFWV